MKTGTVLLYGGAEIIKTYIAQDKTMKKITFLAAAIAFFGLTSIDAHAQSDKKKSKKKQTTEQTEVKMEEQTKSGGQVSEEQTQTQTETEVQSQTQGQTQTQGEQSQNEKRETITQEELPEAVKQTLSSATFSSWQITEVYRVTPNANAGGANAQGAANQSEQGAQNSQAQNAQTQGTGTQANSQGLGNKTYYEIFFTNEQQQNAKVRVDEQGNIIRDQK